MDKIKICKAQNRTALGIFHAYMVMYPDATLEDLRKAFHNSLNPDKGTDEIFIPANEKGTDANWDGYFKGADEIITDDKGQQIAVVKMWTKPSIERLIAKAHGYALVTAQMLPADPGGKKGGYRLEYLNGYVPPVAKGNQRDETPQKIEVVQKIETTQKRGLPWYVWAILDLLLAGVLAALCLSRCGKEPQVVEKTRVVEKTLVQTKTVHDTLYVEQVEQVEEIEKNFNAAQFELDKAELNDDAKLALHDLARVMRQNPNLRLNISGHTSSEGDERHNMELSQARAQATVDFLVNKEGIEASSLHAEGQGSSQPIDPNNLEVNRRTEFEIVE